MNIRQIQLLGGGPSSRPNGWTDLVSGLQVKSNLRGTEAVSDWTQHGLTLVAELFYASGLSAKVLKLTVRDCHLRRTGPVDDPVRVRKVDAGGRRVELILAPTLSRYTFEVDVSLSREVEFAGALAEITAAADVAGRPVPESPALPPPPAALPPITTGTAERLTRMRAGIDKLLTIGLDVDYAQAELERTAAELDAARRELEPVAREYEQAKRAAADAMAEQTALADQLRELEAKLARTRTAHGQAEQAAVRTRAQEEAARGKWQPLAVRVDALETDHRTAAELLEDKRKAVAKMGDVAGLLAALEKLA